MKYLIAACALVAATASAADTTALQFNGYSVTLEASQGSGSFIDADTKGEAQERADQICGSNGKAAELELTETVANGRFKLFYLCL